MTKEEQEFWRSYHESIKDCIKPVLRVWEVKGVAEECYICTIDGLFPTISRDYYYLRYQDDLSDDTGEWIHEMILLEGDENWIEGEEDWENYVSENFIELKEGYCYEFQDFAITRTKQTYPEEQYRLFWNLDYNSVKLGYDGPPPSKSLFGS